MGVQPQRAVVITGQEPLTATMLAAAHVGEPTGAQGEDGGSRRCLASASSERVGGQKMNELKAKATNDLSKLNIIKFVYLNCRIVLVKILTFSYSHSDPKA